MPTPAIAKVLTLLAALDIETCGSNKFIDRSEEEPLAADERPGAIFTTRSVEYGLAPDGSGTMHTAIIAVSFQAESPLMVHTAVAEFIASVHADRLLGGRLQSLEERSAVAEQGIDATASDLELEVIFFTPRGDFFTIVGQAGVLF